MTAFRYQRISEVTADIPLSPAVLGHIEEKTNEKHKKESLAAYALLAKTATDEGISDLLFRIAFAESGKPYDMAGELYFSLSHSGDYVACAISDSPIGVDIEAVTLTLSAERLSARYLLKEETDKILSLSEEERPEAFTRLFSEREAVAKRRDIPLVSALRLPREEIFESVITRRISDGEALYIFTVSLS